MSREWNNYPTQDGQIIYDQKLDKSRQIGLASVALYHTIVRIGKERLKDDPILKDIQTIATQMRYFIVGNNNASITEFEKAIKKTRLYWLSTDLSHMLNLCDEIISAIVENREYVDILINGTLIAGIYDVDQPEGIESESSAEATLEQ